MTTKSFSLMMRHKFLVMEHIEETAVGWGTMNLLLLGRVKGSGEDPKTNE